MSYVKMYNYEEIGNLTISLLRNVCMPWTDAPNIKYLDSVASRVPNQITSFAMHGIYTSIILPVNN